MPETQSGGPMTIRTLLVVLSTLLTAIAPPADAMTLAQARALYLEVVQQHDTRALDHLAHVARQGDPVAQFALGTMYEYGKGVTQSLPTAVHWFKLAAMQRYEPAIQALHALQQQMMQTAHAQPVRTATVAVAPRVSAAAPPVAPPVHDSQQQLQNLQQFWTLYFQAAHAHLVDFGAPALVQPVGFAAAQP